MIAQPYTIGKPLLTIDHVSLAFGPVLYHPDGTIKSAEKLVLLDVNAVIYDLIRLGFTQGQVFGLLGPSGIGKTQLFRILAGLLRPTLGQVLLNAENGNAELVNGIPVVAGMVGVVPQHYPLFFYRKILSNLVVAGMQAGMTKAEAKDRAMVLLTKFNLADKANAAPAELSGGQRQRVCIAQQLMCSKHYILMDEPFSGLDEVSKEEVINVITEVAASDELVTIIVITHEVTAAATVADHLWLMGRDVDEHGNKLPGAKIVEEINLIDRGLAWQPGINEMPEFLTFVRDLKKRFKQL